MPAVGRAGSRESGQAATIEIEGGLQATAAEAMIEVESNGRTVPLLTRRRSGGGTVFVLNIRTFSDADYRGSGEWLLPPQQLGWSDVPQALADRLRALLTAPLNVDLRAPVGVVLTLRGNERFLYNANDEDTQVRLDGQRRAVGPHHHSAARER